MNDNFLGMRTHWELELPVGFESRKMRTPGKRELPENENYREMRTFKKSQSPAINTDCSINNRGRNNRLRFFVKNKKS